MGSTLYLIGGANREAEHFADVHAFDCVTQEWRGPLPATGRPPPPLSGHAAVAVGGDVVLFGGMNVAAGEIYHAVYVFRPATCEWIKPRVTGEVPEQRNAHALAAAGGRAVVLFGGSSPDDGPMNDLYLLTCPGVGPHSVG